MSTVKKDIGIDLDSDTFNDITNKELFSIKSLLKFRLIRKKC